MEKKEKKERKRKQEKSQKEGKREGERETEKKNMRRESKREKRGERKKERDRETERRRLNLIFYYSVGRLILTKAVGLMDDDTDRDAEDITWQYKNKEGSQEERLAVYNAVRGVDKAMTYYEVPDKDKEDVKMDLIELESINYGEPYKARIALEVRKCNLAT